MQTDYNSFQGGHEHFIAIQSQLLLQSGPECLLTARSDLTVLVLFLDHRAELASHIVTQVSRPSVYIHYPHFTVKEKHQDKISHIERK